MSQGGPGMIGGWAPGSKGALALSAVSSYPVAMSHAANFQRLDSLLRGVSRSFYLTLKIVPRGLRRQLSTGYLFCRAADTIADTRLLPPKERLEHLKRYRAQFQTEKPSADDLEKIASRLASSEVASPREWELLRRLGECFDVYRDFEPGDRALIRRLVSTLTLGMEMDLERFPAEESGRVEPLESLEDFDRYCYYVAGCVGEFWTDLQCAHLRSLDHWDRESFRQKGIRFGKGLQATNILRDVDRDLEIGRCYLPRAFLDEHGLTCEELRDRRDRSAVRPIVHQLIRWTLDHYQCGWAYTLAIPRRLVSLRLSCTWPLWIGLRTLALLAAAEDPCAPGTVCKISRPEVRRLIRASVVRVLSNHALDRVYRTLEGEVRRALER